MVKDTEDKAGHTENNEQPNGKCSEGFGVASWTKLKWIDGNLHVEVDVRVANNKCGVRVRVKNDLLKLIN